MKQMNRVLEHLRKFKEKKSPDKSLKGRTMWSIFIWQEVLSYAKKSLDHSWTIANELQLIPDDDSLRTLRGEQTVMETESFVCIVRVDNPRLIFDRDKFIEVLAKKYKLDKVALTKLSLKCFNESKPVLTKRIAERLQEVT